MRKVTVALLALTIATPALAQVGSNPDLLVRDRTGKVIERLEPQRGDIWVRRDSRGNYEGTAETDRTGRVILRAPGGGVEDVIEVTPGYRTQPPQTTR